MGKERDEETGLYYYGAKYYAAWIARWTATDPMANQRVWLNPYNYCQNNPINRTDPTEALDDDPPKAERAATRSSYASTMQEEKIEVTPPEHPCLKCVEGMEFTISDIKGNEDGSYTFTENIKVQEDILISREVENETYVENRKLVASEKNLTTTVSASGEILEASGESRYVESKYSYKAFTVKGNYVQYYTEAEQNEINTNLSGIENLGHFANVVSKSLKESGEFPLFDNYWLDRLYLSPGEGGEPGVSEISIPYQVGQYQYDKIMKEELSGNFSMLEGEDIIETKKFWRDNKYLSELKKSLNLTIK